MEDTREWQLSQAKKTKDDQFGIPKTLLVTINEPYGRSRKFACHEITPSDGLSKEITGSGKTIDDLSACHYNLLSSCVV